MCVVPVKYFDASAFKSSMMDLSIKTELCLGVLVQKSFSFFGGGVATQL